MSSTSSGNGKSSDPSSRQRRRDSYSTVHPAQKTHTIHYLAEALEGHTTLLIAAEQVGLLDEYMVLARLLQPSIVGIEDVDLIARDRTEMNSPCEEVLLNKLLNEMDGLKEDADILFILTTNRPES